MSTRKETSEETIATLQRITDLIRTNSRSAVSRERESVQKRHDLTAAFQKEEAEMVSHHRAERKKLEEEMGRLERHQEAAWADFRSRQKTALDPYNEAIRKSVNERIKGDDELKEEAKKLLMTPSLVDAVALIPEDIRPILIPVGPEDRRMFLMQIKKAPQLAFVIRADEGGTTKFTVVIDSLLSKHHHHLVCFCGNGCMSGESYSWTISALVEKCKQHGITHVFGRKVFEEKEGVVFTEGYAYNRMIEGLITDSETLRYMHYYVSLRE